MFQYIDGKVSLTITFRLKSYKSQVQVRIISWDKINFIGEELETVLYVKYVWKEKVNGGLNNGRIGKRIQ
jgi:hypothetical protein